MILAACFEHVDQFLDHAAADLRCAGIEGMRHTVLQMLAQDLLLGTVQRRAHGAKLGYHIYAIAIRLDHAGEAAHLSFDAGKPRGNRFLGAIIHSCTIPLGGIYDKGDEQGCPYRLQS